MKLAVITATRTAPVQLDATVQSVAALGCGVRHILVGPAALAAEVARRYPGLEFRAEAGGGLYTALNTGLAALGDAEVFTWINDDDVLCPAGFVAAVDLLRKDASLGIVYGRVALMDGSGHRLGELPVAHRPGDLPALLASGIMPLAQPGTVVRRGVEQQAGLFDVSFRLAGDLDFFVRALRTGVDFGFIDAEVARFRLHAGQLSKDEAAAIREHERAVARLPAQAAWPARFRFRRDNLPVYLERIRRHGFVSMRSLYRHV